MISITKDVKAKILTSPDIQERVDMLKSSYNDEECFILAAGPSLNKYTPEYVTEKLKDKLVISIKQSINQFMDIVDFHCLNFTNYQTYNYTNPNTIVVWEVFETYHPKMIIDNKIPCHLMLPVEGNTGSDTIKKMDESQAGDLSFNDYRLEQTLTRWYGPGIMYETVIHLAMHLGVKKITTLGWDIGDITKFGDDPNEDVWQDHSYDYGSEKMEYAPTPMNRYEVETVVKSTEYLYNWLLKNNVNLNIISDTNPAYENIPRVEL